MDSIHDILADIARSKERCVLATVIKVEGSAYRKEGTTMLFKENGGQIGFISGGCLEEDLALQADNLLKEGILSRTIVYDMRAEDDLSWGRGAGCNGNVHILLEKVDAKFRIQLHTLKEHLDQGLPVIALKQLGSDSTAVHTIFVTEDRNVFGRESSTLEQLIRVARLMKKSRILYIEALEASVYIHHFNPKPRLFIFGAGPDVRPLSSMAAKTGFSVHIWDWRPAFHNQNYFPDANFIADTSVPETLKKMNFISCDSVIVMTHDFQKDREILPHLLKLKQISYLGILGPRRRTSRLLNGAPIPEHLHSPVGLTIGADGPEEIAISILADLIRTGRQSPHEKGLFFETTKDSRYLSGSGGK